MPERLTVGQFQDAIRTGRFLPGDAVLYWYPRRNPVQWGIRRTQEHALRDLVAGSDDAEALAQLDHAIGVASQYTHAGMIRNAAASAEMTSPRARLISWSDRLRPGYRLLVVRPRAPETEATAFALRQASAEMLELACHRAPYPYSEALAYWFASWPAKLAGRHFAEVFRDRERDVCSGAVWEAWASAGCIAPEGLDARSEAWYPGRMAWDAVIERRYLECIAEIEIAAEGPETETEPERSGVEMKAIAGLAGIVALAVFAGCVAYRAPVFVSQWGAEPQYAQERSGTQSRTVNGEQQVADTTASQDQQDNTADSNMPNAVDDTRQVGNLKAGQSATGTKALARESATGSTGTGGAGTGQEGGDAAAIGEVPTAGGGGGGTGGTGAALTGGTQKKTAETAATESPVVTN